MTQLIAIKNIKQSSELQPRAKMDTAVIDEYTAAMKRGDAFPAVTVFEIAAEYYLVDGYHRFMAAQGAKIGKILADVQTGKMRDAILFSAGVNAKHGLNRTTEDKRRAATILLRDAEWGQWADMEIAAACNVSVDLVAKTRKAILGETDRCTSETRKVRRAGKVYKMDTSKIGKRPLTQPGPDHPNHGQFCPQPCTVPVTDAPPMEPLGARLKEPEEPVSKVQAFQTAAQLKAHEADPLGVDQMFPPETMGAVPVPAAKTEKELFMDACQQAYEHGKPDFRQEIDEKMLYHPSWKNPGTVIYFCVTNPKEALTGRKS